MEGWISLHRKIRKNPIFNDMELLRLWLICLTEATHKAREQIVGRQTVHLEPGEFVTGRFDLEQMYNAGLKRDQQKSPKTVWRWLEALENGDFLTIKTTNKFSIVSIRNWDKYQSSDHEFDQQVTNKRPTSDQQVTTNNNVNNDNNINKYSTTHGLATIADVHRTIFGQIQIPPIMSDYYAKLLKQGVHENLIMEAMYECGESSAKPNKRLLESIIDRWIKEGINSREENRQRKQQEKRPNIPTNRSGQAPDRLKNGRPVFTVVGSEKEENPLTPEELEELHRLAAKLDGKGEPA